MRAEGKTGYFATNVRLIPNSEKHLEVRVVERFNSFSGSHLHILGDSFSFGARSFAADGNEFPSLRVKSSPEMSVEARGYGF